jgi:hypothetical protein
LSTARHAPPPSRGTRLALALGAAALLATSAFALTRFFGTGGAATSDIDDEAVVQVPDFSLGLGEVSSVATTGNRNGAGGSIRAEVRAVRRLLNDLYVDAFLDPRSWTDGYASVWPGFAEEARADAQADAATLTLGLDAAGRYRKVEPGTATTDVTMLLDPAGRPASAVAKVEFEATAVGIDGHRAALLSQARFFLEPGAEGWTIVGYRVDRPDLQGGPAEGGDDGGTGS